MINSETLTSTRAAIYGLSGVAFLIFAIIALLQGGIPQAERWYTNIAILPGLIGVAVAAISFATGITAGRHQAEMAYDEGYEADRDRAQRIGFWTGIWSPAAIALLWAVGILPHGPELYPVVMLMAAAFFLSFTWLDMRGGA